MFRISRLYFLVLLIAALAAILYYLRKEYIAPRIKQHDLTSNKLGVWLWYLRQTGFDSHEDLAIHLANMGVKRIYIKVSNGMNLSRWPELRDKSVAKEYKKYKIEPWAWSYNYPGNEMAQTNALYEAAKAGYSSFVIDIEKEFDFRSGAAEVLFRAFFEQKLKAIHEGLIDSSFKVYCTTWGNPIHHGTPVGIIDKYVDGFMPQTYLEVWGQSYMENPEFWVKSGTREYRELGATKPVHHIVSTEYNVIDHRKINEFILHGGPEVSLWRIPGGGVPQAVWNTWENVNWDLSFKNNDWSKPANQVVLLDSSDVSFGLNYTGKFNRMDITDSVGFVVKSLKYDPANNYKAPDLCNEKYLINIYHPIRKTIHDFDLSKLNR
jgi:hypothetical protein